jgi:hypothetical protein
MDEQTGPRRYWTVVGGPLTGPIADGLEHLELDSGGGVSSPTVSEHDRAQLHGLLERPDDFVIEVSINRREPRL